MRRTVAATDIERFTEISGDRNPLHYDLLAAQASRFGEIVVQGGITSAILNAVVAEKLPGPGGVFLNINWDFTAPVRPGDIITGRVEVTDVRTDKPITMAHHGDARRRHGCSGRHGPLLHRGAELLTPGIQAQPR
jgi:acyl dehydratase